MKSTRPDMELRVVSLPPTSRRAMAPMNRCSSMSPIASLCASIERRSPLGGAALRSSNTFLNAAAISKTCFSRSAFSSGSGPMSIFAAQSDQIGNLSRSSQGQSNNVAIIAVVSGTEMLDTQSNASVSGSLSNMSAVRWRSGAASFCISLGARAGATVLRFSACSGLSIAMNMRSWTLVSCISKITMPPCSHEDEKVSGSASTATMSS